MRFASSLIVGTLLVATLSAQTPPARPPAPTPESRQFDFWVGTWDVTTPDGKKAGTNTIERVAHGRGLLESWTGAGGGAGKSLNAYNPHKRQWQQYWVGGDGTVLELSGGLDAEGNMVMTGQAGAPSDPKLNRITWAPKADGTVRQLWEVSADGGKTWTTVFDGLYRRKA